jgi:hypothetical protein
VPAVEQYHKRKAGRSLGIDGLGSRWVGGKVGSASQASDKAANLSYTMLIVSKRKNMNSLHRTAQCGGILLQLKSHFKWNDTIKAQITL